MNIALNALDTLFFRDGKPFSMGEEVWANGLFPPPPSVIYGVLRTAYFAHHLDELPLATQPGDPTSGLRITRIFLEKDGDYYVPCPQDLVTLKKDERKIVSLKLGNSPVCSSTTLPYSLRSAEPVKSLQGRFIELSALEMYFVDGTIPVAAKILGPEKFYKKEPKIGIQKSRFTGSSADGRLYRVEMFRPLPDVSIAISIEDLPSIPDTGIMKMGGEGKAVSFLSVDRFPQVEPPMPTDKRFKLLVATPAVFSDGWLPGIQAGNDPLVRNIKGQRVRVLAATLGRAIPLGGFDMARGRPKSMRKAVPAGSIYYVEALDDVAQTISSLHGSCMSDLNLDKQGFGLVFTGLII